MLVIKSLNLLAIALILPIGQFAESQRAEEGVLLKTDLPDVFFGPPPRNHKLPVPYDRPDEAPKLLVPKDTVLLSQDRPVSSSDDMPIIGELELITDGEKETGEGYYVEILEGLQWVQIDLGDSAQIAAVWVWRPYGDDRIFHDVIIQVSDDPNFNECVVTIYNNDFDNSAKLGKGSHRPYVETRFGLLADGKASLGRYVRLYSRGNTTNAFNVYTEVQIFGKFSKK